MVFRKITRLVGFVVATALLALATSAFAQTETGRITGRVFDPQGAPVPGVTVTATNVATRAVRTTVTDATGAYAIPNALAAQYDVSFMLQGFKTSNKRVTLPVGFELAVDAKLELGAVTETVSVTATAAVINVSNAEVSTTVTQEQ